MRDFGGGGGETCRGREGAAPPARDWTGCGEAPPAPAASPARVLQALPDEAVAFDGARIAALFADLGPEGAHATIARARDALLARLAVLDAAPEGAWEARSKAARRLVGIAEGVGMTTLALAARAAADAAARGDHAADAATAARLRRVAALSLAAMDDMEDAPA